MLRSHRWRRWPRYFKAVGSLVSVVVVVLLAVVPWDLIFESKVSLVLANQWPSQQHWLGTDVLGRDVLVRLSEAVRETVLPLWMAAILASLVGALSAVPLSIMKASATRNILQAGTSLLAVLILSLPVGIAVFALAVLLEIMGLGIILVVCSMIFVARGFLTVLDLHARDVGLGYWQAFEASGGRPLQRLLHYGLRGDWRRELLDRLVFHLKIVVTIEASLSYLGFGIQEPKASLGNILAQHFDAYLKSDFRVLICTILVLGAVTVFPAAAASWFGRGAARLHSSS